MLDILHSFLEANENKAVSQEAVRHLFSMGAVANNRVLVPFVMSQRDEFHNEKKKCANFSFPAHFTHRIQIPIVGKHC